MRARLYLVKFAISVITSLASKAANDASARAILGVEKQIISGDIARRSGAVCDGVVTADIVFIRGLMQQWPVPVDVIGN